MGTPGKELYCRHLERRVVARISNNFKSDKRPDLVIWVCHFSVNSFSGIQCPVMLGSCECPHDGPYGHN